MNDERESLQRLVTKSCAFSLEKLFAYRHHLQEFCAEKEKKGRENENDMSNVKNDDRNNYSRNYEPLRC